MMNPVPAWLLAGLLSAFNVGAFTLEEFSFEDPAEGEAFRELIEEIRCLVCQNESLAGSQAELAQDLREEVYRMFQEGRSRDAIVEFLVARYGDFVLYDPPLKPSTYLLWFGPIALMAFAVLLLIRTLVRKGQTMDRELSNREQVRLRELLVRAQSDQDPSK